MIGLIAGALCVATIAGILVNALILQKTRHPAPLFARATPVRGVKEISIAETSPPPAPRPAPHAAAALPTSDKAAGSPPLEKPAAGRLRQTPAAPAGDAVEARQHDPISQLLKAPPAHEPQAAAAPAPNKSVLAAQRALVKLGFVLKTDGVAGTTTRQAIERYERDRKLPVRGEVTPGLLRRLSAESGVPIN